MKRTDILKSIIGDELYESLNKALVKLNTKSVVDLEELHSAIKTAPKSVIAFLMRELKDMKKDETKQIKMPWDTNSEMTITKLDADVYKGMISKDSKVIHDFNLTAIPQLAAHIMSAFEIYDEESEVEASKKEDHSDIKQQIKSLDDKINSLMALVASQVATNANKVVMDKQDFIKEHEKLVDVLRSPSHKDDLEEAKEQSKELKEEIKKSDNLEDVKKALIKNIKAYSLRKAGLAPTMPKPPKPGTKVGGSQGITKEGLHGPKTAASDTNKHPVTQLKNAPYLKVPKPTAGAAKPAQATKPPKMAMSEKTIVVAKSEMENKCIDCGQIVSGCACFKALSKPEIKKSDNTTITLKFKGDWDAEAISALYKSIKRQRE